MVKVIKRVSTVKLLASNSQQSTKNISADDEFALGSIGNPRVIIPNLMEELIDNVAQNTSNLQMLQKSITELQDKFESITPFIQLCDPSQDVCLDLLLKSERLLDFLTAEAVKRVTSSYNVLGYNIPDNVPIVKLKAVCLQVSNISLSDCKVLRLRKKSANHPCPVLFKFKSVDLAKKFLDSGKIIGSLTPYTNIRIVPDLTPCQRRCRTGKLNDGDPDKATIANNSVIILPNDQEHQIISHAQTNSSQLTVEDSVLNTEIVDVGMSTDSIDVHPLHTGTNTKSTKTSEPNSVVYSGSPQKPYTAQPRSLATVKQQSHVATQVGVNSRRYDKRPISVKNTKSSVETNQQKPRLPGNPTSHQQSKLHKPTNTEEPKPNTKSGTLKPTSTKVSKGPLDHPTDGKSSKLTYASRVRHNSPPIGNHSFPTTTASPMATKSNRYMSTQPLRKHGVAQPLTNVPSSKMYGKQQSENTDSRSKTHKVPYHASHALSRGHMPIAAQCSPWPRNYSNQTMGPTSYAFNNTPNTHFGHNYVDNFALANSYDQNFLQRQLVETPGIMHVARMISDQFLAGIANSLQQGNCLFPGR